MKEIANVTMIEALIKSGVTAYSVAKETGLNRVAVNKIFNGTTNIKSIRLDTAIELTNYYLKLEDNKKGGNNMYNKEQVIKLIDEVTNNKESIYFTSENDKIGEKNAFESLSNVTNIINPKLKYVGVFDDEDFDYNDYQICAGDSIYILI